MKKGIYLALAALCAAVCLVLLSKAIPRRQTPPAPVEPTTIQPAPIQVPEKEEAEPYVSPVDWEDWQGRNSDIYAWLSVPGTPVSYPVLQSAEDDEYYLRRSIDGSWTVAGSLFTQARYNALTFDDPCTIIYGHRMNNDDMFGSLRRLYEAGNDFSEINEIVIFLPEKELHYQIFAGVFYSDDHILYYHDFDDPVSYQRFLDTVYDGTYGPANIDESAKATTDDPILILQTCVKNDRSHRFLVIGKLVETIGD